MATESPRRFLLISQPRTASNLLIHILGLENQSSIIPIKDWGYIFAETSIKLYHMGLRGVSVDKWTDEMKKHAVDQYQKNLDTFQKYADDAEVQGKGMLIKEHGCFIASPYALHEFLEGQTGVTERPIWPIKVPSGYGSEFTYSSGNATLFPDEFLRSWQPTFLIRHPALMFPSYYRAMLDLMKINDQSPGERSARDLELALTLHWARTLYDWYMEQKAATESSDGNHSDLFPVVLDADDVINEPRVVKKFAETIGLDIDQLRFTWGVEDEEVSEDPKSKMKARMRNTLNASTGIKKDKAATNIDIDVEAAKWLAEFGPEDGATVERLVRAAMPDYEYLRAKRLTC